MQKNLVISILSILLLVLVLMTIGFGCSFKMENFEDIPEMDEGEGEAEAEAEAVAKDEDTKPKPLAKKKASAPKVEKTPAEPSALTPKEKEMFENIKNGTLTDQDIQKFIAEGKLTEKMVEKFLEHVEAPALPSVSPVAKTAPASKKATPPVEEDFDVEGFSGSMYAMY